jgi:hypothetical protein
MADRALQRDVARREDIGVSRRKQQVHFRRPRTDARHRDHPPDRFAGVQAAEVVQVEPVAHGLRDGKQRPLLGP